MFNKFKNQLKENVMKAAENTINDLKNEAQNLVNDVKNAVPGNKPSNQTTSSSKRTLSKETFIVVGTDYYIQNINKLRIANPEYRKRVLPVMQHVFRYSYINKPVKLIPDPNNPHDRNAIQVLVAGELIGYISREDNVHVGNILRTKEIKYISSFFSGGEYKVMSANQDIVKNETALTIKVSIGYVQ